MCSVSQVETHVSVFPTVKRVIGSYRAITGTTNMALSISRSVGRGIRYSLSRSGAAVFLLTLLSQSVVVVALNTLLRSAIPPELHGASIGVTLPVGDDVAAGLALGGIVVSLIATIIGVRALTRDRAALNELPSSVTTRRLGRAALSLLGSSIIVWLTVTLGSVLVIPGLFFAVSFLFVPFFVCVEDDRSVTALRRSWALASGNRWRLLALLLTAAVTFGVANVAVSLLSLIDLTAAQGGSIVITSVLIVVYIGAIGDTFRQLRGAGQL